jgi:predicted RNase H-like HicB family nuclease
MLIVYQEKDEGFWATVAELPGCFTSGETLEEVRENAKDAIETHLGAIALTGDDLPEPVYTKIDIEVEFESIIAAAKSEITR